MTISYYLPLLIVIFSNICYHNLAKNQPQNVNPFLALTIAYSVSAIVCFILFFIFKGNLKTEFVNINWISYALGTAIVGIELGYIIMYRSGWAISTAALIANIIVALLLLCIGLLFYKEGITLTQSVGAILCIAGLILIRMKM